MIYYGMHAHITAVICVLASRWHPQSTLTHEAGLAVGKVGGEEGFWKFSDAMFDEQEVCNALTSSPLQPHDRCHDLWQEFFDLAINNMTRPQIYKKLAKLAAESADVSEKAVLQQLAFPEGDYHPGSIISKVSTHHYDVDTIDSCS